MKLHMRFKRGLGYAAQEIMTSGVVARRLRGMSFISIVLPALAVIAILTSHTVNARVARFVVEQQRVFADGMSFGSVGPYERLDGTAYMEVSPLDPLNVVIVNLDRAPRNAQGMVEFSAPFFILKPIDMGRGNHKIFYGINNRGNKLEIARFNFAPLVNNPMTAADAGDGFLMRLGYTYLDAGWEGDVAPGNDRLVPNLPVATQPGGTPIIARVRIEYSDRTIPQAGTFTLTLEGSPAFTSYETADTDTAHSTLTVRTEVDGTKVAIPSDRWAFGRCPTGQSSLVPSTTDICLFDGFKADKLYELIYPAKNPVVMGLGYAVTRDIASFLRNQIHDDVGNPNPLAESPSQVGIRRIYGVGSSQDGGYLRDFTYLGFNEDEAHRKVFDAVNVNIGAAFRWMINVEFADGNTYARQDDRHDFLVAGYPPPETYAVVTDPITGLQDGILKRPATDPLVFDTHTESEYYQLHASLNLADGLGQPVPIPDTVRLYLMSSFQHGGIAPPAVVPGPRGICQNPTNVAYQGPTARALLIALDAWADKGIMPPKSEVPDVRNHTLVSLQEARDSFPAIPDVQFPQFLNEMQVLDYGPEFGPQGGRLTILPPLLGASYKILVPQVDRDGLDVAGVRPMEIRVPVATLTGWNTRAPGFRAPNLCGLSGSYIPFAKTKAERLASGDPRKSLEERYRDHDGYVKAVEKAAKKLLNERFLLEEDAARFIQSAESSNILK